MDLFSPKGRETNYAGRSSPTYFPERDQTTWRRDQMQLEKGRVLTTALLGLSEDVPDEALSTPTERTVWYIYQFDTYPPTLDMLATPEYYNFPGARFPTLEYFTQNPVHGYGDPVSQQAATMRQQVDILSMDVKYIANPWKNRVADAPSPAEIDKYHILMHVLNVLARVFTDAQDRENPMPPDSFLSKLRTIHIEIEMHPRFGPKMITDVVHALSRLEIAFEGFAEALQPHVKAKRLDRPFPMSLAYSLTDGGRIPPDWMTLRREAVSIANHMRVSIHRIERKTWEMKSWSMFSATRYLPRNKRMGEEAVLARRVRGPWAWRPGHSMIVEDVDADEKAWQPVVVSESMFTG